MAAQRRRVDDTPQPIRPTIVLSVQRRRLAILARFLEDAHRADLALAARHIADALAALR